MRRALVNDIVRAFTFRVRTGERSCLFLLTENDPDHLLRNFYSKCLVPYARWAFEHCEREYPFSFSCLTLLAGDLRTLTEEERAYATALFERYYVNPRPTFPNTRYL